MKELGTIFLESIAIARGMGEKIFSLDRTVMQDVLVLKQNVEEGYPLDDSIISDIYVDVIDSKNTEVMNLFKEVVQELQCYNQTVFCLNIDLQLAKSQKEYDIAMVEAIDKGVSTDFNTETENIVAVYGLFNNYSLYAISVKNDEVLQKILTKMASL